ncbi:MAG: cytochrome P450 [Kineosporiaceae bacterium]
MTPRYGVPGLPGPAPRDMLAALRRLRRDPVGWLREQDRRFGPVFALPTPGRPVVVVHDAASVRRVLIERHRDYLKATPQYEGLARVTGEGLLAAEHATWRQRRTILAPAFAPGRLPAVGEAAARAGRRWAGAVTPGADVDPTGPSARAALEVLLDAIVAGPGAFDALDAGELLPGRRAADLADAVARASAALLRQAASPFPPAWPGPARRRLRAATAELERHVDALLATASGAKVGGDAVLACLAEALRGGAIDDAGARAEIRTQLVAGHETVAVALAWTLHLLASHPQQQERVREDPSFARPVLEEALRLHPPAWVITRRAARADELAGVTVPAGTLVIVAPAVLHSRSEVFADPDSFDPSRFVGERPGAVAAALSVAGAYLPFGAGPRQCLGRDAAFVQAGEVLSALLAGHVVVPGAHRPTPVPGVTLSPHGGTVRFLPRTPHEGRQPRNLCAGRGETAGGGPNQARHEGRRA